MGSIQPKLHLVAPHENWIVDRFCDEFSAHHPQWVVDDPSDSTVVWAIADWCADRVADDVLKKKKVIASVHHIVPEKFPKQKAAYERLARYVNLWHAPCETTANFIRENLDRTARILVQPFWANQEIWYPIDRRDAKQRLRLPEKKFIIGSFQRDTEGFDLKSPKLEKAPDLFCDTVEKLAKQKQVHVLLGGWRRQYVMARLQAARIPYTYVELPPQEQVNIMYSACDLYIVAARCEGGPQAIVECALTKTPIVSSNVGISPVILAPESVGPVGSDLTLLTPNIVAAHENVQSLCIPHGFERFEKCIQELHEAA